MMTMKSIAVCYSEQAIKVSDSYCSGSGTSNPIKALPAHSVRVTVTCVYKVNLSTGKRFLVGVTWSDLQKPGFSIGICEFPFVPSNIINNYRALQKSRGEKVVEFDGLKFEVKWDLSRAEFGSGPEPKARFYVRVLVNSEPALFLGDTEHKTGIKSSLISRSEEFSGISSCSTRAKFSDTGMTHDIVIRYSGDSEVDGVESTKPPVISVLIDKKSVVEVKRLKWNFRGNETIFMDGLVIDLMWDIHDMLLNPTKGYAVFLFRTRSGLESRLWWEEKEREKLGFSLLISGCKKQN